MFRLVVVSALVAVCLGQATLTDHCCSADDRHTVRDEWNMLWDTPDAAIVKITIGHAIFDRFLAEDPTVASVFSRVNVDDQQSGEWHAHMLRIMGGVDILINMMDDVNVLTEEVKHLRAQHVVREGVTHERMKAFLIIMMDELPKVMTHFNHDAWKSCLTKFFESIGGEVPH